MSKPFKKFRACYDLGAIENPYSSRILTVYAKGIGFCCENGVFHKNAKNFQFISLAPSEPIFSQGKPLVLIHRQIQ